jgi:hypothetical protein
LRLSLGCLFAIEYSAGIIQDYQEAE